MGKINPLFAFTFLISRCGLGRMLCAPLFRKLEILDIVDDQGRICGAAPRSRVHGDNSLLHRVIHVLILDNNGRLLLQKRSMKKKVAPGKWDTSVGGHIDFAESPENAMHREMAEELGIRPVCPEFAYSYIHANNFESELVFTYISGYKGNVKPNPAEIEKVRFWSPGEITGVLGTGRLSDNFEDEFHRYMRHTGQDAEINFTGGGHGNRQRN
ncbi:MAG: NUDIX domain-containing protein [Desulfobacteraceae bacterium]|nr:NUDIX domain-containing protein [Desulfobacteraceae bacterium]